MQVIPFPSLGLPFRQRPLAVLKLLAEAGLIDRFPAGALVVYRLTDSVAARRLPADVLLPIIPGDPVPSPAPHTPG